MARSCAICGKVSMGGFNPQSSGMNRVRAHRRYQPNLQPLIIDDARASRRSARVHPLPADLAEVGADRQLRRRRSAPSTGSRRPVAMSGVRVSGAPRSAIVGVEPDRERAVVDELDRHLLPEPARRDPTPSSRSASAKRR